MKSSRARHTSTSRRPIKLRAKHSASVTTKKKRSRRSLSSRSRRVPANEWTFEVGDPMGISPYIRLTPEALEADIRAQLDGDFRMFYASDASLCIDYPLRNSVRILLTSDDGVAFWRDELLRKIAKSYQDTYAEEERTTQLPVETMAERHAGCFLINRAETNGTFGIYGHALSDLLLHTICYDPESRVISLKLDS